MNPDVVLFVMIVSLGLNLFLFFRNSSKSKLVKDLQDVAFSQTARNIITGENCRRFVDFLYDTIENDCGADDDMPIDPKMLFKCSEIYFWLIDNANVGSLNQALMVLDKASELYEFAFQNGLLSARYAYMTSKTERFVVMLKYFENRSFKIKLHQTHRRK